MSENKNIMYIGFPIYNEDKPPSIYNINFATCFVGSKEYIKSRFMSEHHTIIYILEINKDTMEILKKEYSWKEIEPK